MFNVLGLIIVVLIVLFYTQFKEDISLRIELSRTKQERDKALRASRKRANNLLINVKRLSAENKILVE